MRRRLATGLGTPLRALRHRAQRWMQARTPSGSRRVAVDRRHLYILPTRFGLGFAILVLTIVLGAMNYGNSLAFALGFLLAGIALVAMHQTHGNLLNLELQVEPTPPVFAGQTAQVRFSVRNPSPRGRYALDLAFEQPEADTRGLDLPAAGEQLLQLPLAASRRGWLAAPRLILSSRFPLGLFRAWSWASLNHGVLVYPAPIGERALPFDRGGDGQVTGGRPGEDDFSGLRNYRSGDPARSIHWKSLPKLRQPMVKQFSGSRARTLWLDWAAQAPADPEARLSQLCRWVLEAEACGHAYGLRLPGRVIEPRHGAAHRHACLSALALYGKD